MKRELVYLYLALMMVKKEELQEQVKEIIRLYYYLADEPNRLGIDTAFQFIIKVRDLGVPIFKPTWRRVGRYASRIAKNPAFKNNQTCLEQMALIVRVLKHLK